MNIERNCVRIALYFNKLNFVIFTCSISSGRSIFLISKHAWWPLWLFNLGGVFADGRPHWFCYLGSGGLCGLVIVFIYVLKAIGVLFWCFVFYTLDCWCLGFHFVCVRVIYQSCIYICTIYHRLSKSAYQNVFCANKILSKIQLCVLTWQLLFKDQKLYIV